MSFEVGDEIEWQGARGKVTEVKEETAFPIKVKFDEDDMGCDEYFTSDGRYLEYHKEPSLKLFKKKELTLAEKFQRYLLKQEICSAHNAKIYCVQLEGIAEAHFWEQKFTDAAKKLDKKVEDSILKSSPGTGGWWTVQQPDGRLKVKTELEPEDFVKKEPKKIGGYWAHQHSFTEDQKEKLTESISDAISNSNTKNTESDEVKAIGIRATKLNKLFKEIKEIWDSI